MSKPLTPEEFEAKMIQIFNRQEEDGDTEQTHWDADLLMEDLLIDLGYSKGIEWFQKMPKWYA